MSKPWTETRTIHKGTAREFSRIYLFCPDGHEVVSAGRDGSACGRRLAAGDYSGESCGHGSCTWDGGPRPRRIA